MSQVKNILIPTDFSKHSAEATDYALGLCKDLDAKATLLHVAELANFYMYGHHDMTWQRPTIPDEIRAASEKEMELFKGKLGDNAHLDTAVEVIEKAVAEGVCDFAKKGNFDMIVMGTHGRTGLKHFLLGSVAERVVQLAPCPVLTVRPETKS